tara:strand:+ start:199 stop:318 length:120 start_codon:yes stop_codon:yes gene_type:complete
MTALSYKQEYGNSLDIVTGVSAYGYLGLDKWVEQKELYE